MKLKAYLSERGERLRLAKQIGAWPTDVSSWKTGKKSPPPRKCKAIVFATRGAVTFRDLREDWREHWTEREIEFLEKEARERPNEGGGK